MLKKLGGKGSDREISGEKGWKKDRGCREGEATVRHAKI